MDCNILPDPAETKYFFDPKFDTWGCVYATFVENLNHMENTSLNHKSFSFNTFTRLMKEHFPEVKLAKAVSACCNTCLKYDASISPLKSEIKSLESVKQPSNDLKQYIEKQKKVLNEISKKKEDHQKWAENEREFYTNRIDQLRSSNTKLVVSNVEKSIEEHVLHLSIDAMQNKLYPSFGHYKEPAIYYFTKKITLHLLGVVDERLNKGTVYLYDQRIGPTNSNHTISVLYQALKTFRKTQQVLWINMDNCAVNKNRFVSTSILCSCIDQLRKN